MVSRRLSLGLVEFFLVAFVVGLIEKEGKALSERITVHPWPVDPHLHDEDLDTVFIPEVLTDLRFTQIDIACHALSQSHYIPPARAPYVERS